MKFDPNIVKKEAKSAKPRNKALFTIKPVYPGASQKIVEFRTKQGDKTYTEEILVLDGTEECEVYVRWLSDFNEKTFNLITKFTDVKEFTQVKDFLIRSFSGSAKSVARGVLGATERVNHWRN